jgi:ribulose kinase
MQIHADVSNVPITITTVPEAVTLGTAILASVAGGLHPDVASAARNMVTVARTIEPDAEAHEAYQFFFNKYIASYDAMSDLMHKVVQHVCT